MNTVLRRRRLQRRYKNADLFLHDKAVSRQNSSPSNPNKIQQDPTRLGRCDWPTKIGWPDFSAQKTREAFSLLNPQLLGPSLRTANLEKKIILNQFATAGDDDACPSRFEPITVAPVSAKLSAIQILPKSIELSVTDRKYQVDLSQQTQENQNVLQGWKSDV